MNGIRIPLRKEIVISMKKNIPRNRPLLNKRMTYYISIEIVITFQVSIPQIKRSLIYLFLLKFIIFYPLKRLINMVLRRSLYV